MAEPHAVSALKAKRAELAGEIEATTSRLRELRTALEAVDTTLCLFDPAAVPETIKPRIWRPKADWAKHGEMSRFVLDALRRASQPMNTRDLAVLWLQHRGMEANDPRLVRWVSKRIGTCLRGQRDQGVAESAPGPGQVMLWRLVR